MYVRWPLYLTALLIAANVGVYLMSSYAGLFMAVFVLVYAIIAGILYAHNKPIAYTELVTFATQYGQIQKNLLKELSIPYA